MERLTVSTDVSDTPPLDLDALPLYLPLAHFITPTLAKPGLALFVCGIRVLGLASTIAGMVSTIRGNRGIWPVWLDCQVWIIGGKRVNIWSFSVDV